MQVSWGCTGQIAAQVRERHKGVAQKPQALPDQVDQALVLFAALLLYPQAKHRNASKKTKGQKISD